jgi:hypothetical protein
VATAQQKERKKGRKDEMNDTKTMGLRLPVQAAVDRTTTYATLADGAGVEASINLGNIDWGSIANAIASFF